MFLPGPLASSHTFWFWYVWRFHVCFSLDMSHDLSLDKQLKYPVMCHFVWLLILHLKFMSKLYLILCLLQPIETSQHNFNLRQNAAADSHMHTRTNFVNTTYTGNGFVCAFSLDVKFTDMCLFTRFEIHWSLNVCLWLTNEDPVKVVPLVILFSLVYLVMLGSWPHSWLTKLTSYKMLI